MNDPKMTMDATCVYRQVQTRDPIYIQLTCVSNLTPFLLYGRSIPRQFRFFVSVYAIMVNLKFLRK